MEIFDDNARRMWREYCGVVQLTAQQFMGIQNVLLAEQLELAPNNPWFSASLEGHFPSSIEEFRQRVPLRRWSDYIEILQPDNHVILNGDLRCWVQTSWCHGSWKKVPWERRFFEAQCRHAVAALIMSVARYEGDVRISRNFRVLPILPETPFASAWLATGVAERDLVKPVLAPGETGESSNMSHRVQAGLWRSMDGGVDCVVGMASTLVMARREFQRLMAGMKFQRISSKAGLHTGLKWTSQKLQRWVSKEPWEPKALMAPKSLITWGADTTFLSPALEAQWGAPVFQIYASSEAGIIAMQDWERNALVPLPTSVFLEFLPAGAAPDSGAPLLLNELEVGQLYEPVITSFYGMPFMRLRQGDLLKVVGHSARGVPLLSYHSRADDIIDLGSIARINGATLTEALALVGVGEGQWTARKEYLEGWPVMCLYIRELESGNTETVRRELHRALGKVDPHYREASFTLGYPLLRVFAANGQTVAPQAVGTLKSKN